jgi:cyclophilin family peptidyl-prolyl cis-trans isomerase
MKKKLLGFIAIIALSVSSYAQKTKVKIETEYGDIVVMLYDNTPLNTANMIKLANEHGYDGTLFHRVITEFMIQGGDPDSKNAKPGQMLGNGGLTYTVPAEINDVYYHKRGALGVARDGNPTKAGSASQFYLVVGKKSTDEQLDMMAQKTGRKFTAEQREAYKTIGGTPFLDGNYTVFGEVIKGMDIVDKISMEPRDAHDRPNKDIHIISLKVMKKKKKFLFF